MPLTDYKPKPTKDCEDECVKCGGELDKEMMDFGALGDGFCRSYECPHCGHIGKQYYDLVYVISD